MSKKSKKENSIKSNIVEIDFAKILINFAIAIAVLDFCIG